LRWGKAQFLFLPVQLRQTRLDCISAASCAELPDVAAKDAGGVLALALVAVAVEVRQRFIVLSLLQLIGKPIDDS
jgi:hypothetical protein